MNTDAITPPWDKSKEMVLPTRDAFISKLEALLTEDIHPVSRDMILNAIRMEKGQFKCTQCGKNSINGAEEEGDMGWWCLECMALWEAKHGEHWEDGTPLEITA